MIEGILNYYYTSDLNTIIDITLENNDELIKSIEEVILYKKGIWDDNKIKRTDFFTIKFDKSLIPADLLNVLSLCIKDDIIDIKVKIKVIERNNHEIKLKLKVNLINKIANLIFKLLRFKINININFNNITNQTNINIIYKIKSYLPSSLNSNINYVINNVVIPIYVSKVDTFIKKNL